MLRLTTLGGVALTQDAAPHVGLANQRRRLALLVLVAASGNRGISRDKLLGYLWPEREPERARHALDQALHATRRTVGADDLFLGTAALRLNPGQVTGDVAEFDEAIRSRAYERAVALYGGPFADGFFLDGVPDFERWIEAERARCARDYTAALEALAAEAAARHDHASRVLWCRRLVAAEPLSSRAAMNLIEALVAAGDRSGALRCARAHEVVVRQDLEAGPNPTITAWITRLRGAEIAPAASSSASVIRAPRTGHVSEYMPGGNGAAAARATNGHRMQDPLDGALGHRYAVERLIVHGEVFTTYAARTRGDDRAVELYVLPLRPGAAAAATDHFLRVLVRVKTLADPRILPTYEVGRADDVLFFITAPRTGRSLREHLGRERQLPLSEALRIAHEVASALAHAHEHDVRHGDLRPKHILWTPPDAVVACMGFMQALDPPPGVAPVAAMAGSGAPTYQSPEQLAGQGDMDGGADLYSLGCIMYEMLAGVPPFGASGDPVTISRKLTRPPAPLRSLRADVPEELEHIVHRCLARLPADRYHSAADLRDALAGVHAMA